MKKRIFISICLSSALSALLTMILMIAVLYVSAVSELRIQMKNEATYISSTIANRDIASDVKERYLKQVGKESTNRITLLTVDGTVLYDNFKAELPLHSDRPEIVAAIERGEGESTRQSDTLHERTYYYATKIIPQTGGELVLRLATNTKSLFGLLFSLSFLIILAFLMIFLLSIFIASRLSKNIIKPINSLDLDVLPTDNFYEELTPLLSRIISQKQKIVQEQDLRMAAKNEIEYIENNITDGIVMFSEQGIVLFANKAAFLLWQFEVSRHYLEINRDATYIALIATALKGKSGTEKLQIDGRTYNFAANASSRNDSFAVFLFITDTTEKDNAELLRREFSANVSHELKTPLTTIIGYAELIKEGIVKNNDIIPINQKIYSESKRLLTLIEDIIKLSNLDEGISHTEFTTINLLEVANAVVEELQKKASEHGVTLTQSGVPTTINGIPAIIHEIIYNLCDNGIIYNKAAGTVTITVEENAITIKDSGIGIPPAYKERVFERFFRVDKSHSKETGGTGLGLSIVKHGVQMHGGTISLQSSQSNGTVIHIEFPPSSK